MMNAALSRLIDTCRRFPVASGLLLLTASLYVPTFWWLLREHWLTYGGSLLGVIPLVLGVYGLARLFREVPLGNPLFVFSAALLLMLGLWMLLAGEVAQASAIMGWSLGLVLPGLMWLYAGREGLRQSWFPALCLAMAFPIPNLVEHYLGLYARVWSAILAKAFLGIFGMVLERTGTLLTTGTGIQLEVGNACSGVKTMHVFIVSALVLLQPLRLHPRRFFALLPVFFFASIFANSVRVAALVLIAEKLGPSWLAGASHELTGLFFFLVTFIPLAMVVARWGTKGQVSADSASESKQMNLAIPRMTLALHGVLLALAVVFLIVTHRHQNEVIEVVPPEVPYLLADWSGKDVILAPHEIQFYGVSGLRKRSYHQASLEAEYVSNTAPVSREGLHEPTGCFTSIGWRLLERREFMADNTMPAVLLRLGAAKGDFVQVAVFWFSHPQVGVLASERELSLRMLKRRITLQPEEVWTLHVLAVPVQGNHWEDAQKVAEHLAVEMQQHLK